MQTLQAGPRLASELDYKASSTAVELALPLAPDPKNPFSQPAGPNDAHAVDATPWTRDPATRQWSRYVADPTQAAMGNPTGNTEQASPQRSAELDRAAQATIAHNIEHSRQGIAQRYQDAYEQRGWKQHGPVPAAVLDAERSPPTQQQQAPAARANPAPTQGGMSFADAHKRRDEPEKISPGSLQTVGSLAKPDRQHELTLVREIGIVNAKTEQEFGKAQPAAERTQQRAPQLALKETPVHKQATPHSQIPPAPLVQRFVSSRDESAVVPAATASRATDPRDADHPHHRDFQRIYTTVAQTGHWDAEQSTNIASQVLADFKAQPLSKRLDRVSVEPDLNGRIKVIAGHAPWGERSGLLSMAMVDPAEAARIPAEQGFERLAQASQQQEQQQQQHQEQQRTQQQPSLAPRR
ncbi:MAG: hypothetical protein EOO24_35910 [Comamonadaceae bacterium]|nr:MAG: hypothetical protein EOO24_35910 [Comamonadaceae bacterium]